MSESSKSRSDEYDPVTYHHWQEFELRRLKKSSEDFQQLFEDIMVRVRPGFIRVRPSGNIGDRKCDGLFQYDSTFFQVYSPDELKQAKVQKKINEDLDGAIAHWGEALKTWIFVYNVRRGLTPDIPRTLQDKQQQYPGIKIDHLSNDDLWEITRGLSVEQRNEILGLSPLSAIKTEQKTILLSDNQECKTNWWETCQKLLNHWKGLTTNVLTKPNGVRFQLDSIFVPLGVVERREKPKHPSNAGFPAEQGSELYEEKVTPISQNDFFEQVLRQRQSKYSQGSRIAIIGEPGAGKTTQLQKIGDWILEKTDGIPIWIPLTAVGTRKLKDYLLSDWLQTAVEELDVSQEHRDELGQLLRTGKVWLLLDGVDEMAISDALYQINTQMHEGWLRNVRVVLTCRLNVWDAGKNALDGFDVYRNLDFEYPNEVHQLIDKWFTTESDLQQRLKAALEQPGKERIRDMVENPLRLTLLCYSWQLQQGELPETKAGLYEWFVDAFYEWNRGKIPIKLSATKREELNRALGKLAKEAIDQESSRFRLREKFVKQFLGAADDEDSLFYLALQLGWLNRVGVAAEHALEDVYAFLHPTFQEYFAALAIDDWQFFLDHVPPNPWEGVYRIFEQHWKEIFLLWIGQIHTRSKDKEEIIYSLVDFGNSCEDFYGGFYHYQAYFLAALALSEFPDSSLADRIISQLVELAFGYINFEEPSHWTAFSTLVSDKSKSFLYATDRVKSINSISKLLDDIQKHKFSGDTLNEKLVLTKLVKLRHSANLELGILDISKFLLELDPCNQSAIDALRNLLDCQNLIRSIAAQVLCKINSDDSKARKIWAETSNSLSKFNQEMEFIKSRINDVNQDIDVMNTTTLIEELHESYKRQDFALLPTIKRLGEVSFGNSEVISALIVYLFESSNSSICKEIYLSLNKIMTRKLSPKVVPILKDYLINRVQTISFFASEYGLHLLWHCAQNMNYPDFYRLWYGSSSADAETLIP